MGDNLLKALKIKAFLELLHEVWAKGRPLGILSMTLVAIDGEHRPADIGVMVHLTSHLWGPFMFALHGVLEFLVGACCRRVLPSRIDHVSNEHAKNYDR